MAFFSGNREFRFFKKLVPEVPRPKSCCFKLKTPHRRSFCRTFHRMKPSKPVATSHLDFIRFMGKAAYLAKKWCVKRKSFALSEKAARLFVSRTRKSIKSG